MSQSLSRTETCYHGGAAFQAIGDDLQSLERCHEVIAADVLDAWFPPAPGVVKALRDHLSWSLKTAPPTHAEGLVRAISKARSIPECSIAVGAGSSDLIYRTLPHLLAPSSRVLLLDPMYGEYAHFCRNVMRCSVDTFPLLPSDCYLVDLDKLIGAATSGYDFIVIVNPNNPTGRHIPASNLKAFLERLPPRTTCWIDEAYIDYIEGEESLEATACETANAIVCKSLSKSLALSGARAGYLVANTGLISTIRKWSPPWLVGLPAQIAAIRALDEPQYYQKCYDATRTLRAALAAAISKLDPLGKVVESVGNWVVWVPTIDQQRLLDHCQLNGLYLRSLPAMCAIRIAVKDHETQERMIAILRESLDVVSRTGSLASSR